MTSLPHPTALTRRRLLGLIFLPLIAGPAQFGSIVHYHCDLGESAYALWDLSGPGLLFVDMVFLDAGELRQQRRLHTSPTGGKIGGWFNAHPQDQFLQIRWSATIPTLFVFGSCVL